MAAQAVDVEALVADTARAARDDERLFVGAASWLAAHHGWVNGRRLAAIATDLARTNRLASATMGALLTLALRGAGRAPALVLALRHCRPVSPSRPLFSVIEQLLARAPALRAEVRDSATPCYRRWGLWHDDESLKPAAVRPAAWLLRHVPELRARALLGPSLEADLVILIATGDTPVTARTLARTTHVSYAAAHGAADRLVARALIHRERLGAAQLLQLTRTAERLLR